MIRLDLDLSALTSITGIIATIPPNTMPTKRCLKRIAPNRYPTVAVVHRTAPVGTHACHRDPIHGGATGGTAASASCYECYPNVKIQ